MGILSKIASKRSTLTTKNTDVTTAAQLTLRQSLWPLSIVTILFFLWVGMPPAKNLYFLIVINSV